VAHPFNDHDIVFGLKSITDIFDLLGEFFLTWIIDFLFGLATRQRQDNLGILGICHLHGSGDNKGVVVNLSAREFTDPLAQGLGIGDFETSLPQGMDYPHAERSLTDIALRADDK